MKKVKSYFKNRKLLKLLDDMMGQLEGAALMDANGRLIQPLNKKEKRFNIEVIARAESKTMRFFGHVGISNAQHSVNKARYFLQVDDPTLAVQALLQNASEVFVGNIAPFLDDKFTLFKLLKEEVSKNIFNSFGVKYPVCNRVLELKKNVMVDEALKNMGNHTYWLKQSDGVCPSQVRCSGMDFKPWSSDRAYDEYMKLVSELGLGESLQIEDKNKKTQAIA